MRFLMHDAPILRTASIDFPPEVRPVDAPRTPLAFSHRSLFPPRATPRYDQIDLIRGLLEAIYLRVVTRTSASD